MIHFREAEFLKQEDSPTWDIFLKPVDYPAAQMIRFSVARGVISPLKEECAKKICEQINQAFALANEPESET